MALLRLESRKPGWILALVVCALVFLTSCIISYTSKEPQCAPLPEEKDAPLASGTVWVWGRDRDLSKREKGNYPVKYLCTPVRITGLDRVTAIAAGAVDSFALKDDGTVWEWDGTSTDYSQPKQVSGLSRVVAIAAGDWHTLALRYDGTVWAWGSNSSGKLGYQGPSRDFAAPVAGLADVVAIAAGENHSMALRKDGTALTWGWSWTRYGLGVPKLLELGTFETDPVPKQVHGLESIVSILACSRDSLALKSDGTVWVWGVNYGGSLGDGTKEDRRTPVPVKNISSIVAISCNLALKADGTVWSWGIVPEQVAGLSDTTAIARGYDHSLALKSDGTVWAGGFNEDGQIGNGTLAALPTFIRPTQVRRLAGVRAIAAGWYHSMALQ